MKIYSILLLTLLAGCSTTVPVTMKFPDVPQTLTSKCPELKAIEGDTVSIVDVHKTVLENYTQYHECSTKVDGWLEWYKIQKEIYEKATK
jgi:hypothetical protein